MAIGLLWLRNRWGLEIGRDTRLFIQCRLSPLPLIVPRLLSDPDASLGTLLGTLVNPRHKSETSFICRALRNTTLPITPGESGTINPTE